MRPQQHPPQGHTPSPGRHTKTDIAFQHLRTRLLNGEFAPGTRVVLDKIAAELGFSKVPVREAVTRLIGEGWLVNSPHVGPTVPLLTPQEVAETGAIRGALERSAVRLATPLHTPRSLVHIADMLEEMDRSAADGDPNFPLLIGRFHEAVIAPCPHQGLVELTGTMMERTLRYQTVRRVPEYSIRTQKEHHELFRAVLAGDAELAANIVERHIGAAADALGTSLAAELGSQTEEVTP